MESVCLYVIDFIEFSGDIHHIPFIRYSRIAVIFALFYLCPTQISVSDQARNFYILFVF